MKKRFCAIALLLNIVILLVLLEDKFLVNRRNFCDYVSGECLYNPFSRQELIDWFFNNTDQIQITNTEYIKNKLKKIVAINIDLGRSITCQYDEECLNFVDMIRVELSIRINDDVMNIHKMIESVVKGVDKCNDWEFFNSYTDLIMSNVLEFNVPFKLYKRGCSTEQIAFIENNRQEINGRFIFRISVEKNKDYNVNRSNDLNNVNSVFLVKFDHPAIEARNNSGVVLSRYLSNKIDIDHLTISYIGLDGESMATMMSIVESIDRIINTQLTNQNGFSIQDKKIWHIDKQQMGFIERYGQAFFRISYYTLLNNQEIQRYRESTRLFFSRLKAEGQR